MDWLDEANGAVDFGYDATESTPRRKTPKKTVQAEDRELNKLGRKTLQATARDIRRNEVTARWTISKHIDFVSQHNFQPNTGDESVDDLLRDFFRFASKKENFDISGRYGLDKYMALAESARVVDGDFLSLRLRGGYIQAIESDRIRDPEMFSSEPMSSIYDSPQNGWVQGVRIDSTGRPRTFAVHKRVQSGFEFERNVSARRCIWFGYWDRFDQTRGISPIASVINTIKDLNESYDYALAKSKVAQLFALSITRDAQWGMQDEFDNDSSSPEREINFNAPQILDLDAGEEAKFLSTNTPEADTQAFWQDMTGLVLKSLNIPYSFWNESFTNFNGSRTALILYLRSVEKWRRDQVEWRDDWFSWRLKVAVLKGEIQLPADFVIDPSNWRWVPTGIQYWDALKEARADEKLIDIGLRSRTEIRRERFGDEWADVAKKLSEEKALLEELGLTPEEVDNQEPKEPSNGK